MGLFGSILIVSFFIHVTVADNVILKLQHNGSQDHSEVFDHDSVMTINCTFILTRNDTKLVSILDDNDKTVYIHAYDVTYGGPGPIYENQVSKPQHNVDGWFSIDYKTHRCNTTRRFTCTVVKADEDIWGKSTKRFEIDSGNNIVKTPLITWTTKTYSTGETRPVDSPVAYFDDDETLYATCTMSNVAYAASLTWEPYRCFELVSRARKIKNKWCLYDFSTTIRMSKPVSEPCLRDNSTFTVKCIAKFPSGVKQQPQLTVLTNPVNPVNPVQIQLQPKGSRSDTSIFKLESTITIKCMFDASFDAKEVRIQDKDGSDVYVYIYSSGGIAGPGYQNQVSRPQRGTGYLSVDFIFLKNSNGMFSCHVYDRDGNHGEATHKYWIP